MTFIFLLLWALGVAVALLHSFGVQTLIRLLPWRILQWLASAISLVLFWFLTAVLSVLMAASMGLQYSVTHAGTSVAAYWVTVIALFFDRLWRRPKARQIKAPAPFDPAQYINWNGNSSAEDNIRETQRPTHKKSQERMQAPLSALLLPVLVLVVGIGIGLLIAYSGVFNGKKYASYEECFLAESEGRQQATFPVVKKLCRDRFPLRSDSRMPSSAVNPSQSSNVFDMFDDLIPMKRDEYWKNDPLVLPKDKTLTDRDVWGRDAQGNMGATNKDQSKLPEGFTIDSQP